MLNSREPAKLASWYANLAKACLAEHIPRRQTLAKSWFSPFLEPSVHVGGIGLSQCPDAAAMIWIITAFTGGHWNQGVQAPEEIDGWPALSEGDHSAANKERHQTMNKNPLDFTGKVALVTGAASGMGLATA